MKDTKLSKIIEKGYGNIAQFISVGPNKDIRHNYIDGGKGTLKENILQLIDNAVSKSVNIRSFKPGQMKGNKLVFEQTKEDIDNILNVIDNNCDNGFYSIINENIDINDGGVSGVIMADVIEFAPKDTPKCVEKDNVCSLPRDIGLNILETVYGFKPEINFNYNTRVEFSIHPIKQGVNKTHTIIWEYEDMQTTEYKPNIKYPNKFSEMLGDKVFGLLVANELGLPIPRTTVFNRDVAPFTFGQDTGSLETWIRTAPINKEAGRYYSGLGWTDPFKLMNEEEPKGDKEINIASIINQSNIEAEYSGGAIVGDIVQIEGVKGYGDNFMVGESKEELPKEVTESVTTLCQLIKNKHELIGDVSIEWVYSNNKTWLVQMNQLKYNSSGNVIVEGEVKEYITFHTEQGLEELRELIKTVEEDVGIKLVGNIGITSHFGDLLRLANIPSMIENE